MNPETNPHYNEEMSRIRAYSDIVVQYILGSPGNQDLLLDFLNSVQAYHGGPRLSDVTVLNPFNLRVALDSKLSILDIKAKGSDQRWYNVEVQARPEAWWPERSLYYWAKLYSEQLEDGNHYRRLTPAISISLINFELFPDLPEAVHCILLKHKDHDTVLTDQLQMHYLELPKIDWASPDSGSALEHWLKFFKYEGREEFDMEPLFKETPALEKAHSKYRQFTADDQIRMAYEARQKFIRDQLSFEYEAQLRGEETGRQIGLAKGLAEGRAQGMEQGRTEGRAEGMEQGLAEGMAQGIAEGIAQGMAKGIEQGMSEGARNQAIQMVHNCRNNGLSPQLAAELSRLPLELVQQLYESAGPS